MKRGKKWFAMLVAVVVAFAMGGAVNDTPISQRAIVVGLGIDGNESSFEVTAQILLNSGSTAGKPQAKEVSASDETVSGALAIISQNTSTLISLAHCNLVVLGGGILYSNAFYPVDYLVRNAYLSENALLVGTEGTAKEILKTKVAFSQIASFYAQSTIEHLGDFDTIAERTVKDFTVNQMMQNKSNYLTIIERVPLDNAAVGAAGDEENSQSTGQGSSPEAEYCFDLSRTAIISDSTVVGVLTSFETSGLNIGKGLVKEGGLLIEGDAGERIEVYLVGSSADREYDRDTRTLTLSLSVNAKIKEINSRSGITKRVDSKLSDSETARGAATLRDAVLACYETSKAVGVDIFDITGGLYRHFKQADFDVANTALAVEVELLMEG